MKGTEQAALSFSAGFLSTSWSPQHAQTDTLTDKPECRQGSTDTSKLIGGDLLVQSGM